MWSGRRGARALRLLAIPFLCSFLRIACGPSSRASLPRHSSPGHAPIALPLLATLFPITSHSTFVDLPLTRRPHTLPVSRRCIAHGFSLEAAAPTTADGLAAGEWADGVRTDWTEDAAAAHGGRSALHVAAAEGSEGVLELLLQNNAAVDAEDPTGKTALMLAVVAGEAGCVGQLITRGANISHADHSHATPMAAAEVRAAVCSRSRTMSCLTLRRWAQRMKATMCRNRCDDVTCADTS